MSIQPAAQALISQFTAALDMLDSTIETCPDSVWAAQMHPLHQPDQKPDSSTCWYIVYHALFYTDLYLSDKAEGFVPPEPFTLSETDPSVTSPPRIYTQAELRAYTAYVRSKCVAKLTALDDRSAANESGFGWLPCSYFERQIYNLRHLHEHIGAVNLFAGQSGVAAKWISFGRAG